MHHFAGTTQQFTHAIMAISMLSISTRQLVASLAGSTGASLARWSDKLRWALSRPTLDLLESILPLGASRRVQRRAQWMQGIPMLCAFTVALCVQATAGWHELQLGNHVLAAGWFLIAPLLSVYLLFAGLQRVLRDEAVIKLRPTPEQPPRLGEPVADVRARITPAIPKARDSIP